jgi:hypothetical protein
VDSERIMIIGANWVIQVGVIKMYFHTFENQKISNVVQMNIMGLGGL